MKLITTKKCILLLCLLMPSFLGAQDQRLVKTKVADVLALMPTRDNQEARRVFKELINLGEEGLAIITDQVKPNGMQEGVAARYAVSLLTHYAATKEEKLLIERTYLNALAKSQETEIKAYFIDNIKLVGSSEAVKTLTALIPNQGLTDQAISALTSIGTENSKSALLNSLATSSASGQARLIKALGELRYLPALPQITDFASNSNLQLKKQALWAIALLADRGSAETLYQQAKNVKFENEPTEATSALLEYLNRINIQGNKQLILKISNEIIGNTLSASQQHFRLAAYEIQSRANPTEIQKILIKERNHFDGKYRREILKIASANISDPLSLSLWSKEYGNALGEEQAELLFMLASNNRNESFVRSTLVPALTSKNSATRIVASAEIANSKNKLFAPFLIDYLLKCQDNGEILSAKSSLLQLIYLDNIELVGKAVDMANPKNKVALLQLLADRRAVSYFSIAAKHSTSQNAEVRIAAFEAFSNLSAPINLAELLKILSSLSNEKEIKLMQNAIISSLDKTNYSLINEAYQKDKIKLLPVLPFVSDAGALSSAVAAFKTGNDQEHELAFEALTNWPTPEAARMLLTIIKDETNKKYYTEASRAYLSQVSKSSLPDEQKLLMLKEAMSFARTKDEKISVIRAIGGTRTFLSLMFVSEYLDDAELGAAASRAAMQIALPTADARPGLTGMEVRKILNRILSKLTGEDSQYERIDIATYLENLPYAKGFESIFNGVDLTGWQGLVENPIIRSKMTKAVLAAKQLEANAKVKQNWSVSEGCILFEGEGANLCTVRPFGDFEMIVDWKISKEGDSGIYLRGSPQIQIWDNARIDVGAQVGSGGLYNNKKEKSIPLVVADNPVGEWNTFHIKMIGDRVTVYLNGILVTDNVVMENYWDRSLPIFSEEAIELQAHGTKLAFRNLYIKELGNKSYQLTTEEKKDGFEVLFNGKDLDNWVGNKTDYVVEDNTIAIYPTKEGHGNLNSAKEYSDFVFRFEFQLTPGANNGLGIHAPLDGDAAYVGKEIQILDNTAAIYANLEPYQYHGSVYGIIAAKRDYLRPVGEWNGEEVYVKGDYIKVTLNGTVIVEGDMKKATTNGTLDHKDHPGLNRHSGHIAFLGHGSVVKFRSIRIKELTK